MRVVSPDEREPAGATSLAVIVEDLTRVRNTVIELIAEAEHVPDMAGENLQAQLAGLRAHAEVIIGVAQAERAAL
jgi:hypothetical protein